MPESIEMCTRGVGVVAPPGRRRRVAVSTSTGPHIVPVNYAVVDDAILFRTSPYSLVATQGVDTVIAFEVDDVNLESHHAWSVVVRGTSEAVTDPTVLAHIQTVWEPRPWAAGSRNLVVRLPWEDLTGRKLGVGWSPVSELEFARRV